MNKQLSKVLSTILSSSLYIVLLSASTHRLSATENQDPNGTTNGSDLVANTCAFDVNSNCVGTCTYQDWTWQHCKAGTSNCTDQKNYVGSPYPGVCYKTASGSINFVWNILKWVCQIQVNATCGGYCDCKKSGT